MTPVLPGIELTFEQNDILGTCKPPQNAGRGQLVRVTAAAGTGKTTTLLALALRAIDLGHRDITYLTFTNAAARDGTNRLSQSLAGLVEKVSINARTLHSCAYKELSKYQLVQDYNADTGNKVWSEKKVKKWISETLNDDIEDFLAPCWREIQNWKASDAQKAGTIRTARDRVEFFIFKSLRQFCIRPTTRKEFEDPRLFGRDYYPAKQFHESGKGDKLGFNSTIYRSRVRWYADQACKLWSMIEAEDIRSFDFMMKRAQLLGLPIPGSILLIDESQDMDGCQVNWVAEQQVKLAKHVYVVGDAAQSIYGFRGAKSEYLMDLSIDNEKMLTESWRFGPGIAAIANLILFSKENSDQTSRKYDRKNGCQKWKNWSPYRVAAGLKKAALVTESALLSKWRDYRARSEKITFIARQNKTLFSACLLLIGFNQAEGDKASYRNGENSSPSKGDHLHVESDDESDEYDLVDASSSGSGNVPLLESLDILPKETFPRFHINGFGENSGRKAWFSMFKLIGAIFELFMLHNQGEDDTDSFAMKLPIQLFPEFAGRQVTWISFCEDVREREMGKYTIPISVVNAYEARTMAAVELFKKEVIERNYSVEEADIILTTCHAAKGMEWDHVQVADDFIELANYTIKKESNIEPRGFVFGVKRRKLPKKWKFGFAGWGDDLNLAYVAATRAKTTLSLPPCLADCIHDFDLVSKWHEKRDSTTEIPSIKGLVKNQRECTSEALEEIWNSLVIKFREEVEVACGCSLRNHMLLTELAVSSNGNSSVVEVTPSRDSALENSEEGTSDSSARKSLVKAMDAFET